LAPEALALLNSADGPTKFRSIYGDYYVCGYELGADAGACMSASTESSKTTETKEITVAVKVLFYSASTTHKSSSSTTTSSSTMSFCSYNSLEQTNRSLSIPAKASTYEQTYLQQIATEHMQKIASLSSEVRKRLKDLDLDDGEKLPWSICQSICQSGLVVELLLAPFSRLNQYIEHACRPLLID
jgi:hypothetical protein